MNVRTNLFYPAEILQLQEKENKDATTEQGEIAAKSSQETETLSNIKTEANYNTKKLYGKRFKLDENAKVLIERRRITKWGIRPMNVRWLKESIKC